jgi:hypothetical protein
MCSYLKQGLHQERNDSIAAVDGGSEQTLAFGRHIHGVHGGAQVSDAVEVAGNEELEAWVGLAVFPRVDEPATA